MGIETAFLMGVLVGQWIMFWAMWRRISRLAQYTLAQAIDLHAEVHPGGVIIELPPETFRDED